MCALLCGREASQSRCEQGKDEAKGYEKGVGGVVVDRASREREENERE